LGKSGTGNIIFYHSKSNISIVLPAGKYQLNYINPKTGEMKTVSSKLKIDGSYSFETEKNQEGIYWFKLL
jgi:hypothetical protein